MKIFLEKKNNIFEAFIHGNVTPHVLSPFFLIALSNNFL